METFGDEGWVLTRREIEDREADAMFRVPARFLRETCRWWCSSTLGQFIRGLVLTHVRLPRPRAISCWNTYMHVSNSERNEYPGDPAAEVEDQLSYEW